MFANNEFFQFIEECSAERLSMSSMDDMAFEFGHTDVVYRSCSAVENNSSSCGVGEADYSNCQFLFDTPATKSFLPEQHIIGCFAREVPPLIPYHLSQDVFDVREDPDAIIHKINNFLASKGCVNAEYAVYDFTWRCVTAFPCAPCHFEIRVYRYPTSSQKTGQIAVEMQVLEGDRVTYSEVFRALKEQFVCSLSKTQPLFYFETAFSSLPAAIQANDMNEPTVITERAVKQVLFDALVDERAGYASKMEAVQIAASIFAQGSSCTGECDLDEKIYRALKDLSIDAMYCINPVAIPCTTTGALQRVDSVPRMIDVNENGYRLSATVY